MLTVRTQKDHPRPWPSQKPPGGVIMTHTAKGTSREPSREPLRLGRCIGSRDVRTGGGPTFSSEDIKLAKLAKAGDTAAYERLVRNHEAAAFRTAYLITGDASEAEDAAQEAFVKAYRALGRFQSGAPFRPWLLAVVANEAKNRRKAALRRADLALRAGTENH